MDKLKVLAGFDSDSGRNLVETLSADNEYEIVSVSSLDEMLQALGIFETAEPTNPPTVYFDWCIMDADLDVQRRGTCASAIKIYNHLRGDIERGQISFRTFTEDKLTKRVAEEKDILVIRYREATKLVEFYEQVRGK